MPCGNARKPQKYRGNQPAWASSPRVLRRRKKCIVLETRDVRPRNAFGMPPVACIFACRRYLRALAHSLPIPSPPAPSRRAGVRAHQRTMATRTAATQRVFPPLLGALAPLAPPNRYARKKAFVPLAARHTTAFGLRMLRGRSSSALLHLPHTSRWPAACPRTCGRSAGAPLAPLMGVFAPRFPRGRNGLTSCACIFACLGCSRLSATPLFCPPFVLPCASAHGRKARSCRQRAKGRATVSPRARRLNAPPITAYLGLKVAGI